MFMLHVFEKMRGFVILMLFLTGCQANISNQKIFRLKKGPTTTQGKLPASGFLEELSARNKIDCAISCTDNNGCVSMYYLEDIHVCKLHSQKIDNLDVSLDNYSTAVYYEVDNNDPTIINSTTSSIPISTSTATTNSPTSSIPTSTSTATTNSPTSSIPTSTSTATTNSPTSSIPTSTSTTATYSTTSSLPTSTTMAPLLESAPCPPDDSMFRPALTSDGTLFQFRVFMDVTLNFSPADSMCQSHGAKLYKILTPEKMSFNLKLMSCPAYNNTDFWANGMTTDGTWFTTDGEPIPMTSVYWAPDRPNDSPPKFLYMANKFGHFLDDKYREIPLHFICEK